MEAHSSILMQVKGRKKRVIKDTIVILQDGGGGGRETGNIEDNEFSS